jgi:hypothetical protein
MIKKFLILMLLTGVPFYSYASTYSSVPTPLTGQTLSSIELSGNLTENQINRWNDDCVPNGATGLGFYFVDYEAIPTPEYPAEWYSPEFNYSTNFNETVNFTINGLNVGQIILVCLENGVYERDLDSMFDTYPLPPYLLTTALPTPPATTTTGLFGTSSMGMINNVTQGVQTTGGAVLPFIALAGLPIAFLWGRRLITFIKIASK